MRDIKFRAWDKKYKRMFPCGTFTIESNGGKVLGFDKSFDGQHSEDENDFVVIEYTGVQDQEGNDLYEGDVVQPHNYRGKPARRLYKVEYGKGAFVLKSITDGESFTLPLTSPLFKSILLKGNIYQNPELLANERNPT